MASKRQPAGQISLEDVEDTTGSEHIGGIVADARQVFARLASLGNDARIDALNQLRLALAEHSPLAGQPVDCVVWVPAGQVRGNAYNPNVVAPPEMELLRLSVAADGFTQPIVAWPVTSDDGDGEQVVYEVVDGFHRHRIGKEDPGVRAAVRGRLPLAVINPGRTGQEDRVAATIRHNRARGQHTVDGMSEIVVDLARRGKSDEWIGRELGLDSDEVRRLRQITGLAEMFADEEFSEAWEVDTAWADGARYRGGQPLGGE
ncbi:IbrB-like domain-containing protein [Sphaerisporangium aureirubrum]|uniref:IbrB-like domain-containing protein n=1 Tax=Sphaerisporangium aureirubrum TaxID=1544736 RepID=A0ABW1ND59_9ACTN